MATGPLIQQRIDRILCATSQRNPGAPVRVLIVAALTLVALTIATAEAAVGAGPASAALLQPVHVRAMKIAARTTRAREPAGRHHGRVSPVAAPVSQVADAAENPDAVSYNPRALLAAVYVRPPAYVPASTIVVAGRTFFIRSTERPVAEVVTTDGTVTHGK